MGWPFQCEVWDFAINDPKMKMGRSISKNGPTCSLPELIGIIAKIETYLLMQKLSCDQLLKPKKKRKKESYEQLLNHKWKIRINSLDKIMRGTNKREPQNQALVFCFISMTVFNVINQ